MKGAGERPLTPEQVLDFWFAEPSRARWFNSTPDYDQEVRERFADAWEQARHDRLAGWEQSADGALALVILLDQLPLNMFRNQPHSFSTEAQSRRVAGRAIERGFDRRLPAERRAFLYLPYMHSEFLADQDRAVELFALAGLDNNLKWARHHREIIRRFGRFPHRNAVLGRESTRAELEWLQSPQGYNP